MTTTATQQLAVALDSSPVVRLLASPCPLAAMRLPASAARPWAAAQLARVVCTGQLAARERLAAAPRHSSMVAACVWLSRGPMESCSCRALRGTQRTFGHRRDASTRAMKLRMTRPCQADRTDRLCRKRSLSRHQRPQPSPQEAEGQLPPGSASGQPTRPDKWRMEAFRRRETFRRFSRLYRFTGTVPVKRHRGDRKKTTGGAWGPVPWSGKRNLKKPCVLVFLPRCFRISTAAYHRNIDPLPCHVTCQLSLNRTDRYLKSRKGNSGPGAWRVRLGAPGRIR